MNYKSWKNMSENFLFIKYEDLLMDPDKEFAKIVKFLNSILNIEFNKNKITEAIKTSSFDNLKKLEKFVHKKVKLSRSGWCESGLVSAMFFIWFWRNEKNRPSKKKIAPFGRDFGQI